MRPHGPARNSGGGPYCLKTDELKLLRPPWKMQEYRGDPDDKKALLQFRQRQQVGAMGDGMGHHSAEPERRGWPVAWRWRGLQLPRNGALLGCAPAVAVLATRAVADQWGAASTGATGHTVN